MNYGNQGAPGNLPCDPMRLLAQPNINWQQPPFVPNLTGQLLDPHIANAVPELALAITIEVNQHAGSNPLRTHMFNMCATNNYANDTMHSLVRCAADWIALELGRNRFPGGYPEALRNLIPFICRTYACFQVNEYPALEGYLQPQDVPAAREGAQLFLQMYEDLTANRARMGQAPTYGQAPVAQGYGYPGPQGGGYQPPQMQNSRAWAQRPSDYGQGMQNQGGITGFGSTRVFRSATVNGQGDPHANSRYARSNQPVEQTTNHQPQVQRNNQPAQPVNQPEKAVNNQATQDETVVIPAEGNYNQWSRSDSYPYFPAMHTSRAWIALTRHANNPSVVVPAPQLRDLSKPENNVDFTRHNIAAFGPIPKHVQLRAPNEVMNNLREGNRQIEEFVNKPAGLPVDQLLIRAGHNGAVSMSELWLQAAMERLAVKTENNKTPFVYRTYARLHTPFVSTQDDSEAIVALAGAGSWFELHRRLGTLANTISPALWNGLNDAFTEKINNVLRTEVGVVARLDNFWGDWPDLLPFLETEFSRVIANAFLSGEAGDIRGLLLAPYNELDSTTHEMFKDPDSDAEHPGRITWQCSDISLTLLNCTAHELDITLNPELPNSVSQRAMPDVYELLRQLFSEQIAVTDGDGVANEVDRHLIRTNDGHVMQATRGRIALAGGDEFYLLSLVN